MRPTVSFSIRHFLFQSLGEPFQGLPRTFWYLWLGTLVNSLGALVLPFLGLYLVQQRGFDISVAGLVVAGYGAGSFVAAPLGGWLADRLGRRRTLMLALFSASAAMLTLSTMHSLWGLAVTVAVLGLCTDLGRPSTTALLADVVPPADRVRAYGVLYLAFNLGLAIATALGGLLARTSFFWLFVGDAATTFCFGLWVVWKIPETHPDAQAAVRPPAQDSGAWRDGALLAFCLLGFFNFCVVFQSFGMLPLAMAARGLAPSIFGGVIALNGVLIVVAQPFLSRWVVRFPRARVMAASSFLFGLGFMLCAWARTPLEYAGTVVVWTLGEMGAAPVANAIVADLAPRHARGRYQGVYFMAIGSALFAGPALGGLVMQHLGSTALWLGCGAMGTVSALGHLLIAPARRERMRLLRSVDAQVLLSAD